MKKISAKLKLTLLTSLFMILMASMILILLFSFSDTIIETNSKARLSKVVGDNAGELEFEKGRLDTDDVDFFDNGVYTLLYNEEGEHVAGNFPEEFETVPELKDNELTEVLIDGTLYYIYDILASVEDSRSRMWVRGVIAVDEVANTTNSILQLALLMLPVLILLATFGSYVIAKKTFQPIDKIVKTAEEIQKSDNLSLRIAFKDGSAELYKLASTFDTMFEHLEKSFEAEKQFTSDVSHELRTPTAVILAQCEYALGQKISVDDKEEALEAVQRQAKKMAKLIEDLLHLIRFERGIEKTALQCISLSELVSSVCDEQKLIAPLGIAVTQHIEQNIKGEFDSAMMARLLTNLISNSFRYGKENGSTTVTLGETDTTITLSVADDGIGIAKENQSKIWHRFYQVDSSRSSSQGGSMGLGLSMVWQIVKLHKGTITVESELEKGSTFTVTFLK